VPRHPEPDAACLLAMARAKLQAIRRGQDKGWELTAAAREVLPGGMESDVARLVRKFGRDEARLLELAAAAPSKIAEKSKQSSETNRNWASVHYWDTDIRDLGHSKNDSCGSYAAIGSGSLLRGRRPSAS